MKSAARQLPTTPRSVTAVPKHVGPSIEAMPSTEPEQAVEASPPAVEPVAEPPLPIVVETDSVIVAVEPMTVSDEPPSAGALLAGVGTNPAAGDKPSPDVSAQKIGLALEQAKQAVTEQKAVAVADSQLSDIPSADAPPLPPTSVAADGVEATVPHAVTETAQVASSPLPEATQPSAGTAELDEAVRENPGDAQLRSRRGQLRLEQQQFAAAAADFEEALKVDPALNEARYGRARANYLAGRLEEAIDGYADVLRHDDQHAAALIERGHCLSQLGRAAEAARDRQAALALDPSLAKTGPKYEVVVETPSMMPVMASDVPTEAVQPEPSTDGRTARRDVAVTLAVPATEAETLPGAVFIGDADTASSTSPASVSAVSATAAPFETAVRELTLELQKTPGDARLYELRAQALLALGRAEDAVDDLTAAVRIDPTSSKAFRLRSRAYATQGRTADAEADRRRAQDLAPSTP